MPKKKKLHYVDAVEKLENSTSVHVPKKLMLFVGNLPEDITKEQLMEHFKRTGKYLWPKKKVVFLQIINFFAANPKLFFLTFFKVYFEKA